MRKEIVSLVFSLLGFSASFSLAAVPYQAIELGTLGSTDNWSTETRAINDAGQVVGWSKTADGKTHAFLWENGIMTDIGTFQGQDTYAYGINEKGQVIGRSYWGSAFIWDKMNGMRGIGSMSLAYGDSINESGQVAGFGNVSGLGFRARLYDPQVGITTLWPSEYSAAYGINDLGQVVGGAGDEHAALWDINGKIDLGTLGGIKSRAIAINNAGLIVGYSETSTGTVNPFLWSEEQGMINLVGLDGGTGWAFGINDIGQVVGGSHVEDTSHVFLWDNQNGATDISGPLGLGDDYLMGWDINNKGQIVAGRYMMSPIPEPGTILLLGLGITILRRKK
jgi:probable HAF family extracellular repeat protein